MSHFQNGASPTFGGTAVAVPGQPRGLKALHQKYGKLSWRELFEPSIKMAREGFVIGGDLREVS